MGVPPSPAARRAVADYMASLSPCRPMAKWVPAENLHYTVQFIGSVADDQPDAIADALDAAVGGLRPFELALGQPGRFPSTGKSRVLWIGAREGEEPLALAARAVSEALRPWVEPEERPFVAHLTIARFKYPESVGDLPPLEDAPSWTCCGVVLYESRLGRPAPVYEALHEARFAG